MGWEEFEAAAAEQDRSPEERLAEIEERRREATLRTQEILGRMREGSPMERLQAMREAREFLTEHGSQAEVGPVEERATEALEDIESPELAFATGYGQGGVGSLFGKGIAAAQATFNSRPEEQEDRPGYGELLNWSQRYERNLPEVQEMLAASEEAEPDWHTGGMVTGVAGSLVAPGPKGLGLAARGGRAAGALTRGGQALRSAAVPQGVARTMSPGSQRAMQRVLASTERMLPHAAPGSSQAANLERIAGIARQGTTPFVTGQRMPRALRSGMEGLGRGMEAAAAPVGRSIERAGRVVDPILGRSARGAAIGALQTREGEDLGRNVAIGAAAGPISGLGRLARAPAVSRRVGEAVAGKVAGGAVGMPGVGLAAGLMGRRVIPRWMSFLPDHLTRALGHAAERGTLPAAAYVLAQTNSEYRQAIEQAQQRAGQEEDGPTGTWESFTQASEEPTTAEATGTWADFEAALQQQD
jgi:hypothetical protein